MESEWTFYFTRAAALPATAARTHTHTGPRAGLRVCSEMVVAGSHHEGRGGWRGGGVASVPPTLRRRPTPELDPPQGAERPRPLRVLRAHPTARPGSAGVSSGEGAASSSGEGWSGEEGGGEGAAPAGGNAGRAGGQEEEAAGRRAARLLSPAPLPCSQGTTASAGPPPRGLPSPSPAAAPLHRAAARIPARLYPPAPGSEKAGNPAEPRPGWGSWVPARLLACLPPAPPPLPDEPRWPPGFLRAEPSSDMNRKGPPPPRPAAPGRPAPAACC